MHKPLDPHRQLPGIPSRSLVSDKVTVIIGVSRSCINIHEVGAATLSIRFDPVENACHWEMICFLNCVPATPDNIQFEAVLCGVTKYELLWLGGIHERFHCVLRQLRVPGVCESRQSFTLALFCVTRRAECLNIQCIVSSTICQTRLVIELNSLEWLGAHGASMGLSLQHFLLDLLCHVPSLLAKSQPQLLSKSGV